MKARVLEALTVETAKMKQVNCSIWEVGLVWHGSLSVVHEYLMHVGLSVNRADTERHISFAST